MSEASQLSPAQLEYFLHPRCVRERSRKLYEELNSGNGHWVIHPERLSACADYVVKTIQANYPTLQIPFHSRRGHLRAGGVDRVSQLRSSLPVEERLIAEYDLIITSVFVDAGAGDHWSYRGRDGKTYTRSEGLAVASFDLFLEGLYSSNPRHPTQVDAQGLESLNPETFAKAFQASASNPLLGLETRLEMLKRIAICLRKKSEFFEHQGSSRLGHLGLYLKARAKNGRLAAAEILRAVLLAFEDMWPERISISPVRFGDIWNYSRWSATPRFESLIAFHKLSQWLSYSLMEALQDEGLHIEGLDELTGLPEYRNGGLFVDLGVLSPKDPQLLTRGLAPHEDALIEWRAATVTLLDELAPLIRTRLGKSAEELPLVKILEGGTWSAGRRSAQEFRHSSSSPVRILSDGSVF